MRRENLPSRESLYGGRQTKAAAGAEVGKPDLLGAFMAIYTRRMYRTQLVVADGHHQPVPNGSRIYVPLIQSTMYTAYNRRLLPSPHASVDEIFDEISESHSDSDAEFMLFEGSESLTSGSFDWSSSEISTERERRDPPLDDAPHAVAATTIGAYPRRPIPLMAWFAFLLAADDATLHLLEHPHSMQSPLFPGPSLERPVPETDPPDTQHGLYRLSHRPRALRDGAAVALDSTFVASNPFAAASPFHILSWVKALLARQ